MKFDYHNAKKHVGIGKINITYPITMSLNFDP